MSRQRYTVAVACLVLLGLAGFLFARYVIGSSSVKLPPTVPNPHAPYTPPRLGPSAQGPHWVRPEWMKFGAPKFVDYTQQGALGLPEGLSTAYAPPPDIHHEIIVNEFRGLFRSGTQEIGGVMVFAGAMRHDPAQGFLYAFYRDPPVYNPILFLPPRGTGALKLESWQKLGSSFRLTAVTQSEQSVTLDVPLPLPYARYSVRTLQLRNQIRRL